jgi:hypothetical protein
LARVQCFQRPSFCYPCRKYGIETAKSETAFTSTGYFNWKNALDSTVKPSGKANKGKGLKGHNKSEAHVLCMTKWENSRLIAEGKMPSIANLIDPERESLVSANREYFKHLVRYHIYFCKNELPYRGDDESEDTISPGNWKDFVNMQLETNSDFKKLHDKVKAQHDKYDYTSKRSCNELV